MRVADILACLGRLAPPEYADDGDPIGLQIGSPSATVTKAMVCLTVEEKTVAQAKRSGAQIIVAHHPLIHRGLLSVCPESYPAAEVEALVHARIALTVAHTNLDVAPGGVNDALAASLGLTDLRPLKLQTIGHLRKLVVFVPETALKRVRRAICDAGAGRIGNYSGCTFRVSGTGTFTPESGAMPAIGRASRPEEVKEYRLESVVPAAALERVLHAVVSVHPYEEPAYDVYPLELLRLDVGHGRVGRLLRPLSPDVFVRTVARRLKTPSVRTYGTPPKRISKVAICSGAGDACVGAAADLACDAYLTGEIRYHAAIAGSARGMFVAAVGHAESEQPVVEALGAYLSRSLPELRIV